MPNLTRRVGKTGKIGDETTIRVLGVRDIHVPIVINASGNIVVHCEDIYKRIKQKQQTASRENIAPQGGSR